MDPSISSYSSLDFVFQRPAGLPPLSVEQLAVILNHLGYVVMENLRYMGGLQLGKPAPGGGRRNERSEAIAAILPREMKNCRMLELYSGTRDEMLFLTDKGQWLFVKPDEKIRPSSLLFAEDGLLWEPTQVPEELLGLIQTAGLGQRELLYVLEGIVEAVKGAAKRSKQTADHLAEIEVRVTPFGVLASTLKA